MVDLKDRMEDVEVGGKSFENRMDVGGGESHTLLPSVFCFFLLFCFFSNFPHPWVEEKKIFPSLTLFIFHPSSPSHHTIALLACVCVVGTDTDEEFDTQTMAAADGGAEDGFSDSHMCPWCDGTGRSDDGVCTECEGTGIDRTEEDASAEVWKFSLAGDTLGGEAEDEKETDPFLQAANSGYQVLSVEDIDNVRRELSQTLREQLSLSTDEVDCVLRTGLWNIDAIMTEWIQNPETARAKFGIAPSQHEVCCHVLTLALLHDLSLALMLFHDPVTYYFFLSSVWLSVCLAVPVLVSVPPDRGNKTSTRTVTSEQRIQRRKWNA